MRSKNSTIWTAFVWAVGLGVCVGAVAMQFAATEPEPQKAAPAAPTTVASDAPALQAAASKAPAPKALAPAAMPARAVVVETTTPKAPVQEAAAVTITGCLERNDEAFRLKDTAGSDAPKGRSWKSGFLKKGSSQIDVVDAANRVKLPNYVGQRVSVTGTLVDREMQVHSLQRVAESCTKS